MSPASGQTAHSGRAGQGEEDPPQPCLVVSRCLGFAHCPYDGSTSSALEVEDR